jgi:hypothetical protein
MFRMPVMLIASPKSIKRLMEMATRCVDRHVFEHPPV